MPFARFFLCHQLVVQQAKLLCFVLMMFIEQSRTFLYANVVRPEKLKSYIFPLFYIRFIRTMWFDSYIHNLYFTHFTLLRKFSSCSFYCMSGKVLPYFIKNIWIGRSLTSFSTVKCQMMSSFAVAKWLDVCVLSNMECLNRRSSLRLRSLECNLANVRTFINLLPNMLRQVLTSKWYSASLMELISNAIYCTHCIHCRLTHSALLDPTRGKLSNKIPYDTFYLLAVTWQLPAGCKRWQNSSAKATLCFCCYYY